MAASKLARVFSGYAAEACMDNVRRAGIYWGVATAYTAVTPALWHLMICHQLMLRHGVGKITWQRPTDCLSRHVVTREEVRNVIFC